MRLIIDVLSTILGEGVKMGKLDEVFNEMNKDIETQNKLRVEMYRCKKELEESERKYYESTSLVCSPLHQIVSIVKTYDNSKKELFDIGVFLATYDGLELHKLCDDVLRDGMDISEISKICDAITNAISEIVPHTHSCMLSIIIQDMFLSM